MNISRVIVLALVVSVITAPTLFSETVEGLDDLYAEACAHFENGAYEEAELAYARVVELDPSHVGAYNNLGLLASSENARIKESVGYFLKAAKLDPTYADPFANLGIILYKMGQHERAEAYLKRAVSLDPGSAKYHFTLGWVCLAGKENYEEAIKYFKKATELKNDYVEAHYILGMAYVDLGRKIDVFEEVTKLRRLNKEVLASRLEELVRTPYVGEVPRASSQAKRVEMSYEVNVPVYSHPVQKGSGKAAGSGTMQLKLKFAEKEEM